MTSIYSGTAKVNLVRSLALLSCLGGVLGGFDPGRALADECAACDQYLRFVPEYQLAGSVAAIGTVALHPEGHAFNVGAELADALKRQIAADSRIPDACRKYVSASVRTSPSAELYMSGALGAGGMGAPRAAFAMSGGTPVALMSMLGALVAAADPCTSLRPVAGHSNTAYLACLSAKAQPAFAAFSRNAAAASPSQIAAQLSGLGFQASSFEAGIIRSVVAAFNSSSTAGLQAWAAHASRSLGTEGFLTAVQMLGWEMNTMYNHARENNIGDAGHGIVSVSQALASMQNGAAFMIHGAGDPAAALADFAVICRDAAVVQVTALRAGGFTNAYEVSYRTSTGGHVDVIAGDPSDRTKMYLINWSGRENMRDMDGSDALFEGSGSGIPDYSLNYVISNVHTVGDVPSNMMKFLNEAAGGDNAVWDPLARTNNSMLAASFSPVGKGLIQIRGVYGSDGNGATYAGAATDAHWGAGTHFPGEIGFFGGQQARPAGVYEASTDGTALVVYGQAVQHAITPAIKLGSAATGVLDAHLAVAGGLTQILSGPDHRTLPGASNTNFGGDTRLGAEARIDQTAMSGRLKAQYVVGGNALVAQSDVRDADLSSYTVAPLNVYLGARATLDVGQGVAVFGQTLAVIDQIGARDRVEVGVASRHVATTVYEAGRITNDTALVQDNSLRRVGVSVTTSPTRWLRLGLNGEVPLEGDAAAGARVYGNAAVVF